MVRIEDDPAVDIARRAADPLDERGLRTEKPFLVGVQDGDELAFGNVEALAQQVDADENVERAKAEVADDLDAFERFDVRMHVTHAHALLVHIFGEVFGHALRQHGDEAAPAFLRDALDLRDDVIDLV